MLLYKKEDPFRSQIKFAWFPTAMNNDEVIWWEYYEYRFWGMAESKVRLKK